jgi:hypothetical protein
MKAGSTGRIPSGRSRGAVYVLAVLVLLIASAVGLGMAALAVTTRTTVLNADQADVAYAWADAGIEYALWYTGQDDLWRTRVSGEKSVPWAWSDGRVAITYNDPDGSLTDDGDDSVEILSTGEYAGVQRTLLVQAEPVPIKLLDMAIHAGQEVIVDGTLTATAPVSSNSYIQVKGGRTLDGDAEAAGAVINGGTITGTVTQNAPTKRMPDSGFIAHQMADATSIDIFAIPGQCIGKVVLSPANNPYGTANPAGVYYIQCYGRKLMIQNCRIVGTLIIENCKSDSVVSDGVVWETPSPDRPALIVNAAKFTIDLRNPLDEAACGVNFNPAHTPYEGQSDSDTTDVYTSQISGMVYAASDLDLKDITRVEGTVVAEGAINTKDTVVVTYDPQIASDPPSGGLRGPALRLIPGTYRRIFPTDTGSWKLPLEPPVIIDPPIIH